VKPSARLRKRIDKVVTRDLERQRQNPDDTVVNALAFVMDVNRAVLKTMSELVLEIERLGDQLGDR
jgi:hypothetical protein